MSSCIYVDFFFVLPKTYNFTQYNKSNIIIGAICSYYFVVTDMNVEETVSAVCFLLMMVVINIFSGYILMKATFNVSIPKILVIITVLTVMLRILFKYI